jgi:ATP-dependent Clp protease ATP-binding subunit ClpC
MDGKHHHAMSPTDVPLSAAVLQLIADAKDESAHLRHEYIGTEHLVLALSRQAGDAAPLAALAVEPQRVYTLISETVGRGRVALEPEIERPFTSRTKRAFSLAAESAHQLGHTHIGVAHLLVGLLRERLNIGAQVLAHAGLTEERAYEYAQQSGAQGR